MIIARLDGPPGCLLMTKRKWASRWLLLRRDLAALGLELSLRPLHSATLLGNMMTNSTSVFQQDLSRLR